MGPWLVLASPCFRENVVATCKIESFLCSLDNLLQKFLQHISHSHTYTYFAHPIDFFALPILKKKTNLSGAVSLWYESSC